MVIQLIAFLWSCWSESLCSIPGSWLFIRVQCFQQDKGFFTHLSDSFSLQTSLGWETLRPNEQIQLSGILKIVNLDDWACKTVLFAEKPENTQFSFSKFSNLESSSYHLSPSTWQQLEWISGCTAVENGGRSSFPRSVSECPLFTSGHLLWAVTWGLHRGSRWHHNSWMANSKYPHPLTPAPPSYPLSPKLIDRRNQLIKIRPACDCLCFVGTWWLAKKQKTYRAR